MRWLPFTKAVATNSLKMSLREAAHQEFSKLCIGILEENQRIQKEALDIFQNYVDPRDAFLGPEGDYWPRAGQGRGENGVAFPFTNDRELEIARDSCRNLYEFNDFARGAHENRISYIVGTGHTYLAVPQKNVDVADNQVEEVQLVIDEFVKENTWHKRQSEIVLRVDRDGEVFIRKFVNRREGMLVLRFLEPEQIFQPGDSASDPLDRRNSWGVITDENDVETVFGYWVDEVGGGDPVTVSAEEIQHRKQGVSLNTKRGVPLLFGARKNLNRAQALLRNMAAASDIQTAIAMIRQRAGADEAAVKAFQTAFADTKIDVDIGTDTIETFFKHYGPGTIIDAPIGTEYTFPAQGLDASRYVTALQAILRGAGARVNMPEFMFTGDASNSNMASTLVAEGPAHKSFERLQENQAKDDMELIDEQVELAVSVGRLPRGITERVEIQCGKPRIAPRELQVESKVNEIYERMQVKSVQTISNELGLDYDQEQDQIEDHKERTMDDFPDGVDPAAGFGEPDEVDTGEPVEDDAERRESDRNRILSDLIALEEHTPSGQSHDQKKHGKRGGNASSIKDLRDSLKERHNLEQLELSESDRSIELSNIRVRQENQGEGIGSEVINELKDYATKVDKPIIMTIEPDPGMRDSLERFYKKHGFVRPGGSKDFSLPQHSHIWKPSQR